MTRLVGALLLGALGLAAAACGARPPPRPGTLAADRAACDAGQLRSCVDLGLRYVAGGKLGAPDDPAAARGLFERACEGGVLAGCHALGVLYQHAIGMAPSHSRARDLYRRACEGGHLLGCVSLGGIDELLERPDRARGLYLRACAGHEPLGCRAACRLGEQAACALSRSPAPAPAAPPP